VDTLSVLNTVALVGFGVSQVLFRNTLTAYATAKGKNLATKEDTAEITRLVESTKLALQHMDRFEAKKYELKYDACLTALRIIDAQLSHIIVGDSNRNRVFIEKQFANVEELRACQNRLILSVDNPNIVMMFVAILHRKSLDPVRDLDSLRGLIRTELGFTGEALSDSETTWFGSSQIGTAARA
jgi:hypothetical protein